ncbi:MAG: sulfite exporter TauE/SafE family protein [Candidatus Neomarinimicrobiota bacterium]
MAESLTFASIFFLGCFHALEPGHGKTFLLAYTIGQKLDLKKIIILTLSLLFSHLLILSIFVIFFNILLVEIADKFLHNLSHWFVPLIIILFGTYVIGRAIYESKHKHNKDCGHDHGKFTNSKIKNPLTVGFLTGLMPCASSLSVVFLTGTNPNILSIMHFMVVYVLGIATILFLMVTTFSFTKNLFLASIQSIGTKINLDLVSGCLIFLVGLVYLSYNWGSHVH